MALAKPEAMNPEAFLTAARSVCEWFTPLNPYEQKGPLLKIEDANYGIDGKPAPLFCYAVSAKRLCAIQYRRGWPPHHSQSFSPWAWTFVAAL
jgi:hypothetical protein